MKGRKGRKENHGSKGKKGKKRKERMEGKEKKGKRKNGKKNEARQEREERKWLEERNIKTDSRWGGGNWAEVFIRDGRKYSRVFGGTGRTGSLESSLQF